MPNITINCFESDAPIRVDVIATNDDRAFAAIRIGEITIYSAGYDAQSAAWLRDVASKLTAAADQFEPRPVEAAK